ncbi:MAG: PIG-L family deacetylase [Candidatus Omnitrophica bacterium]|nr:PIG-L family deacetylase [Candidatus Omnitrophota bacterium]
MKRYLFFIFFGLSLVVGNSYSGIIAPLPVFTSKDRVLICAPHPDDEVLGCAGIIQQALAKTRHVYIVFLTNGDHNWLEFKIFERKLILHPYNYIQIGELRRKESINAEKILGVPKKNLIFLGYPDAGTMLIWLHFWNKNKPYYDFLTKINHVPYPQALSYGSPYVGESIISDFVKVMNKVKPTKIFITNPVDTNSDHRAISNFLLSALLEMKNQIHPDVYFYLVHYYKWPLVWPKPRRFAPNLTLIPPKDLLKTGNWFSSFFTSGQIDKKASALMCFRSELIGNKGFILSFARRNESFEEMKIPVLNGKEEVFLRTKIYHLKISQDPKSIIFKIILEQPVKDIFNLKIEFFGYNDRIPFSIMPKLGIQVNIHKVISVRNENIYVPADRITYIKNPYGNEITLVVPKLLLENPQYIFVGGESRLGDLLIDSFPWKLFKISK